MTSSQIEAEPTMNLCTMDVVLKDYSEILKNSWIQDAEVQGGLQGLIEDLAQKMRAAGESALLTAKGIRNSLGRILIHLGASLHAFL